MAVQIKSTFADFQGQENLNPCAAIQAISVSNFKSEINRHSIRQFIGKNYLENFGAELHSFLPNLVAITDQSNQIKLAFGFKSAASGPLFLETYHDKPIENLLSECTGVELDRNKIVEIGNLAPTKDCHGYKDIARICNICYRLGYQWIVCTATRQIRLILLRMNAKYITIGNADRANVTKDETNWGSYYQSSPMILAGNLTDNMLRIKSSKRDTSNRLFSTQEIHFFPRGHQ